MTRPTLNAAIVEAERFLRRAKSLVGVANLHPVQAKSHDFLDHPKEQGAVKRASMDLTRILADLRAGR